MKIKGVITGDIIQSTRIKPENKQLVLDTIRNTVYEMEKWSKMKLEIFRGDSFQIVIDNTYEAVRIAILIRAGLQKSTPEGSEIKWDARLALGLGSVNFPQEESVTESDGEAFRNSGWEFDELGKRKLAIRTPWQNMNDELKVSTAFADDIVSEWSVAQAQAIYASLIHSKTQKEIAADLNTSPQNISKRIIAGKEYLIRPYLDRCKQIITAKIQTDGIK
ncbi:hypothetical protein GPL06_16375 [Bacteroides salyersiae]|uniref:SatD family protein n=1 Tax=Bacteroides salyersiae TaxID=291644 RepID=UPI001C019841|nr:SatD family protein [Bacteroides salyersiae]MBT9874353.1 hypothetical protein [Bacteroides salyersiae]